MVVRAGRVTDASQSDLTALLRTILQQQTAVLQVQAESVRLQRLLVERLLGLSVQQGACTQASSTGPATSTGSMPVPFLPAEPPPPAPTPTTTTTIAPAASEAPETEAT